MEQIPLHIRLSFSAEEGAYGWFTLQSLYWSFSFLCKIYKTLGGFSGGKILQAYAKHGKTFQNWLSAWKIFTFVLQNSMQICNSKHENKKSICTVLAAVSKCFGLIEKVS